MIELLLATRNPHKTAEFAKILGEGYCVSDLSGAKDLPVVEETGDTFEANAILKAMAGPIEPNASVIADDSGLEVDALNGAPGIFSARYSGENATDAGNVAKLLANLERSSNRAARFRCVIALMRGGKLITTFDGRADGTIVDLPRGNSGFGYDPIFMPNGFDQTFGELSDAIKNRISHRAKAARALAEFLGMARSAQ